MMLSSLLQSLLHPRELTSLFRICLDGAKSSSVSLRDLVGIKDEASFCWSALGCVSRSFTRVIQLLPGELRESICIFYLVLRALDTVEDDMSIAAGRKIRLLMTFHERLDESCKINNEDLKGIGENDENTLLENFSVVQHVFRSLKKCYREIIRDITRRMGEGMSEFTGNKSIESVSDYNLYCHYVAGLVGHGLTEIFANSGLEEPDLHSRTYKQANAMGLFLQKTNIIRDFLEDFQEGRTFWPSEVTTQFDHGEGLDWFAAHPDHPDARRCLNAMVADALEHLPDCIQYLSHLQCTKVFEFCAVPQMMALATIAEVCDNTDVFKRVVKIRKGLAARLMLNSSSMSNVQSCIRKFTGILHSKMVKSPCFPFTIAELRSLKRSAIRTSPSYCQFVNVSLLFIAAAAAVAVPALTQEQPLLSDLWRSLRTIVPSLNQFSS